MTQTDIPTTLGGYVREALALRLAPDLPGVAATSVEVLAGLQHVRRCLDRVEELLGMTLRVRARAQRAAVVAQATADDAWDNAIGRVRSAPVKAGGEFTSARERHAEANLVILDLRHAARHAVELAHHCDEAVEIIRLAHRGLDGVRQDHLAILRALAFESHLER